MKINIQAVISAAEKGGNEVNRYFGQILEIEEKSMASDFRTKADTESEKAILKVLSKEFPDFNLFSEEKGLIDNKSPHTFIIDPLDGSNNFVMGIPNFSVSIGLVINKVCVLGVIHQPVLKQIYYAEQGKGAFLGEKRLHVNDEENIKKSTVAYTCGYSNSSDYSEKLARNLHELGIKRMLTNWSPAIDFCMLASGKTEAVINNANEIYDYIAGKLIARESGALISGFDGRKPENDELNIFLASNGKQLHQDILQIL